MGNVLHRREIAFAAIIGLLALGCALGMPWLVAKPKLLFGRSLSAIDPTLFPMLTLSGIVLLCIAVIAIAWRTMQSQSTSEPDPEDGAEPFDWVKVAAFFGILVVYALMFKPFGFLVSSFCAISASALLLGNRNLLQVVALAVICPLVLYVLATRGLLVSLPELDIIELGIARVLG